MGDRDIAGNAVLAIRQNEVFQHPAGGSSDELPLARQRQTVEHA